MKGYNYLGYEGFLTDEDRKKYLEYGDTIIFTTCLDLSCGIKVRSKGFVSIGYYSQRLSEFMVWWSKNILPWLNGFSGADLVRFDISELKIL